MNDSANDHEIEKQPPPPEDGGGPDVADDPVPDRPPFTDNDADGEPRP